MFNVQLSEAAVCNVEEPPDQCLRRGNGALEILNEQFNILVIWQPRQREGFGRADVELQKLLRSTLEVELKRSLQFCFDAAEIVTLAWRRAVDGFQRCIYEELWTSLKPTPRVFAILPLTPVLGFYAGCGHLLVDAFTRQNFEVLIILLPY